LAGALRRRGEVSVPSGYAVFDCETTGTDPDVDEIVDLVLVQLDCYGVETGRFSPLVQPSCPIPEDANVIHGICDADVADAPAFAELAGRLFALLEGRVFAAHNASFDLAMLHAAFRAAGLEYRPAAFACTLDAYRVLEPLAEDHRLGTLHRSRRGSTSTPSSGSAHEATPGPPPSRRSDACSHWPDSQVSQERTAAPTAKKSANSSHRVAGVSEPDVLTREQVQDVYDELERLIDENEQGAVAAAL
jgi:hypothetical protein